MSLGAAQMIEEDIVKQHPYKNTLRSLPVSFASSIAAAAPQNKCTEASISRFGIDATIDYHVTSRGSCIGGMIDSSSPLAVLRLSRRAFSPLFVD